MSALYGKWHHKTYKCDTKITWLENENENGNEKEWKRMKKKWNRKNVDHLEKVYKYM